MGLGISSPTLLSKISENQIVGHFLRRSDFPCLVAGCASLIAVGTSFLTGRTLGEDCRGDRTRGDNPFARVHRERRPYDSRYASEKLTLTPLDGTPS